jgi:hypothetical protein
MAEEDRADEQAGEQREHEGADPGDAKRPEDVENAQRFGREIAGLDEARGDVGGQEQIVELETAAQRDQRHQPPDVPASSAAGRAGRQALQAEPFGLRHAAKMRWHRRDTFFAKLIPADGARRMP